MSPETLIAFLMVVTILGLVGLYIVFFLFRKKTNDRLDILAHTVDSLDERLIHEFRTAEKKHEEGRAKVVEALASFKAEFDTILAGESEARQAALEKIGDTIRSTESELRAFQDRVEGQIAAELRESISNVSELANSHQEKFEGFKADVDRVRLRNDLQFAHALVSAGDFAQAGEVLEGLLNENPGNKHAALLASKAWQGTGEIGRAAAALKSVLERLPGDPDLLAESARLAGREGNRSEQARAIAEGLVRSPNHARLHFERALLHIESGNYNVARHDLEQSLAGGLDTPEIHYNLGMVHVATGDIPAGIRELRRSIALDPLSAEANHALGLALTHVERYREAVDFLERARELKPDDVSVRVDLAAALRLSGSPAAALTETQVAGELAPESERVTLERALAYHDLAEFSQALACLDAILKVRPEFRRARELKAEILGELERHREAVEEWTLLAQQHPNEAGLKARLASSYKAAGDPGRTLGYLQMAARMAPESGEIQLQLAREALVQGKLLIVQEALESAYPRLTDPQMRLRFLEGRLLLLVKLGRFALLDSFMRDLKTTLEQDPEVVPLDHGFGISGKDLLLLSLSREGARLHNGLQDLYAGRIDYEFFDSLVTEVMRSLLPPPPPPPPPVPPPIEAIAVPAPLVEGGDNGREVPAAAPGLKNPAEDSDIPASPGPEQPVDSEGPPMEPAGARAGGDGETGAPEEVLVLSESAPPQDAPLQPDIVLEDPNAGEDSEETFEDHADASPEISSIQQPSDAGATPEDRPGKAPHKKKRSGRSKRKSRSTHSPSQE